MTYKEIINLLVSPFRFTHNYTYTNGKKLSLVDHDSYIPHIQSPHSLRSFGSYRNVQNQRVPLGICRFQGDI